MTRISEKRKAEMAMFLDEHDRIRYNMTCLECENSCEQSFRTTILHCPAYIKKVIDYGNEDSKGG